ncbi:Starch-binding associating with outer membrane [Mucilaginibacter pineti]|uniref:Starch-binding associating with outer membrane n=1 Tax=Mucilaginibacter pineti TaxID=1391627 RepID=A0A1G6X2M9_9SPHI|nr:RagB/SusD family nutrient uptake outer membrane protein [Mucilaginibacter pineti]SDD71546.1 Starch-binding associating with outer membrane [Mucilaginibacter pineti]
MKRYINQFLFVLAILLCGTMSCKKVLEKPPLTAITADNYFKNGDDAESAITGCYDALQDDGYYGSVFNIMGEMPSDDATSSNADVFTLDKIQWTSTTSQPGRFFQNAFKGINRVNSVIKYVPAITTGITPERRGQIVGEAYFLRALHYFNLVKCFGGVSIHLTPTETEAQAAIARSTTDQVYAQIESDLSAAEGLLPNSFGNTGIDRTRATKGAVNALQAKVYLYERKWQLSISAAGKVISNSNYGVGLTTPFNDLLPFKNKQESIFEVQYAGTDDGGFTLPDLVLPSPPASYSFPKYNIPTDDLMNAVDKVNDERWKNRGTVEGGVSYTSAILGTGDGNDGGWFVYKWRNTNFFASKDNYPLLTLDDVYLMYAEASNELNGPTTDGLDKLNAILKRANLDLTSLTVLSSKDSFRNEVDKQRRFELAFQGDRWFDLVRYSKQTIADPSAVHKVNALDIIKQQRGDANVNYLLFAIPLDEMNSNPLAKQNPGF